jgi:hypothetical protein
MRRIGVYLLAFVLSLLSAKAALAQPPVYLGGSATTRNVILEGFLRPT